MIDVSDGLVADAGHIAADSGVAIDISAGRVRARRADAGRRLRAGVDPMQFILGGGDDHAIVATFPAGTDLPEGFTAIGSAQRAGGGRSGGHGRRRGVRRTAAAGPTSH